MTDQSKIKSAFFRQEGHIGDNRLQNSLYFEEDGLLSSARLRPLLPDDIVRRGCSAEIAARKVFEIGSRILSDAMERKPDYQEDNGVALDTGEYGREESVLYTFHWGTITCGYSPRKSGEGYITTGIMIQYKKQNRNEC